MFKQLEWFSNCRQHFPGIQGVTEGASTGKGRGRQVIVTWEKFEGVTIAIIGPWNFGEPEGRLQE